MNTRTSAWSLILAFDEAPPEGAPAGIAPRAWATAGTLDTLDTVLEVVVPENLLVVSDQDGVIKAAAAAGSRTAGTARDLNTDVVHAVAEFARQAPERSAAVLVGPVPFASASDLFDALRACAAAESAVIVAPDGGTVLLSHHDPAALRPRFGGASGARHMRSAVRVGAGLEASLTRVFVPSRAQELSGRRQRDLLANPASPLKETR